MKKIYGRLRERIKEKFGTLGNFAYAAGCSKSTLCYKLTGKAKISTEDIELYCKLLELPTTAIPEYFFYN